jgi:hypothetical protein
MEVKAPKAPWDERGGRMGTSKQDASQAAKILANPKSTKTQKSVAGSDLAQRKPKSKAG